MSGLDETYQPTVLGSSGIAGIRREYSDILALNQITDTFSVGENF